MVARVQLVHTRPGLAGLLFTLACVVAWRRVLCASSTMSSSMSCALSVCSGGAVLSRAGVDLNHAPHLDVVWQGVARAELIAAQVAYIVAVPPYYSGHRRSTFIDY